MKQKVAFYPLCLGLLLNAFISTGGLYVQLAAQMGVAQRTKKPIFYKYLWIYSQ